MPSSTSARTVQSAHTHSDAAGGPSSIFLNNSCLALKWSNATGHLVKVVKLPIEVIHDSKEEKAVYP